MSAEPETFEDLVVDLARGGYRISFERADHFDGVRITVEVGDMAIHVTTVPGRILDQAQPGVSPLHCSLQLTAHEIRQALEDAVNPPEKS